MNKLLVLGIALGIVLLAWLGWLGWLGWRVLDSRREPSRDPASSPRWKTAAPTSIENEPVKIFQRAFWASPTSEDQILHAERREWKDADGVQKWQWFLVVEPSAALLKRLRDDNAFGLVPAATVAEIVAAPEWFAFNKDEVSVLKSLQAQLQLIFSKDHHTLYATDSGLGFRAGVPEPVRPSPPSSTSRAIPGRLPSTHPPRPEPASGE
ncbi:MAG: hypothetical protein WCP45_17125 [Verrucomicrobiota bacterium]